MKIICPVCGNELTRKENSYICLNGHSFDIARQGYINLYRKSAASSGDESEMIQARSLFLKAGHYHFLREQLNTLLTEQHCTSLVDLACGEGYYTSFFEVKEKIGVDLSKPGLKIASRNDPETTYILSTIFSSPIESQSADAVLTCFAPVARKEIARLLKKDGIFILVTPGKRHLYELKEAIYEQAYENDEIAEQIDGMSLDKDLRISSHGVLKQDELQALFKMTPYFHKTSSKDKEKLTLVDELDVTFEFLIRVYRMIV